MVGERSAEKEWRAKLLRQSAKEVQSFVQGCCQDNWIQAAMVLANEHVFCLISDLDSCISISKITSEHRVTVYDSDTVKGRMASDQLALLTKLETEIDSSNANNRESQLLAKCLANRLRHYLPRAVQVRISDWEIKYTTLKYSGLSLRKGSFGEVRKSTWLGVDVAEKLFIGSDHPSFLKEVEILARLSHPNIVPLFGYATDRNGCSIVMELMDKDLQRFMSDRLRQDSTLAVPFSDFEAVVLMLQIARGMRYLHDKGVVHRDLKGRNVLVKVCSTGCVKLKVADFGLSGTRESSVTNSKQPLNIGTTRWMAPEVMMHAGEEDSEVPKYPFKVDVYSFGMVCYEILSGKLPFHGISNTEVRNRVLEGDRPKFPHRCPGALKALICSCWNAKPNSRPMFDKICESLEMFISPIKV